MSDISTAVAGHYGRGGLTDRLLSALAAEGKDIEHLTVDDLAPLDEFHSRRRRATEELAGMLAPTSTSSGAERMGKRRHATDRSRESRS